MKSKIVKSVAAGILVTAGLPSITTAEDLTLCWAAWDPANALIELSKDFEGKAVIGKIDVDANQEFAAKYGVRNIPTVLLFKDGELVSRQVGVAPKKTYEDAINAAL